MCAWLCCASPVISDTTEPLWFTASGWTPFSQATETTKRPADFVRAHTVTATAQVGDNIQEDLLMGAAEPSFAGDIVGLTQQVPTLQLDSFFGGALTSC